MQKYIVCVHSAGVTRSVKLHAWRVSNFKKKPKQSTLVGRLPRLYIKHPLHHIEEMVYAKSIAPLQEVLISLSNLFAPQWWLFSIDFTSSDFPLCGG